jgi:hypothetical protein
MVKFAGKKHGLDFYSLFDVTKVRQVIECASIYGNYF